jgi:hypothetical protein
MAPGGVQVPTIKWCFMLDVTCFRDTAICLYPGASWTTRPEEIAISHELLAESDGRGSRDGYNG